MVAWRGQSAKGRDAENLPGALTRGYLCGEGSRAGRRKYARAASGIVGHMVIGAAAIVIIAIIAIAISYLTRE